MPYLLSDWRDRIQQARGEYRVAREALHRLNAQVAADATTLPPPLSEHLEHANSKLEGTYIVRVFAVFDAALRSYDRYHFGDQERDTKVAVMIDQLGSLLRVARPIREGVHRARRVRHYWAHELEGDPGLMLLEWIKGYLHAYLDSFPKTWT